MENRALAKNGGKEIELENFKRYYLKDIPKNSLIFSEIDSNVVTSFKRIAIRFQANPSLLYIF